MKILIAPDKFKGFFSSAQIAETLRDLIQKQKPMADVQVCPLADGGDGTLDTLINALKVRAVTTTVHDPLMRPQEAVYGLAPLPEKNSAIIEMAQASGLSLVEPTDRNPLETTSYGTGELVLDAYKNGARNIRITLGGSATVDGGLGFLQALGARISSKVPLPKGAAGKHMNSIDTIDLEPIQEHLKGMTLTGLVDVRVPLLGDHGSARLFGPQKGATPEIVEALEKGMTHLEAVLLKTFGVPLKDQKGSGAAGGMGMAILALGGKLESGFDFVSKALKLEEQMKACDLVITGEGKMDASSLEGKTPVSVSLMAKELGVPCVAIVGAMDPGIDWLEKMGISKVYPLFDKPIPMNDPRRSEMPERLKEAVASFLRDYPGV